MSLYRALNTWTSDFKPLRMCVFYISSTRWPCIVDSIRSWGLYWKKFKSEDLVLFTYRNMYIFVTYMTNLDSILKTETLLYQQSSVYSNYGFSSSHVWMWELDHKESWAPKNWCFELWYWRRLLRVPWIARRYNQSILKEISPEYSSEGLMLKL